MVESRKQLQVSELIKRNFGLVLQAEAPLIVDEALVTVTTVKMSSDLGLAKIYLSVFNTLDKPGVILALENQKHRLQQSLVTRIRKHVRRIPKIDFYLDDTLDEMDRLNSLFQSLK